MQKESAAQCPASVVDREDTEERLALQDQRVHLESKASQDTLVMKVDRVVEGLLV